MRELIILVDKAEVIMMITVIIFSSFLILATIDFLYENKAKKTACQDIGYDKVDFINDVSVCIGKGRVDMVDFECKGIFGEQTCFANIINLGTFNVFIGGGL